jgi:hypothetical protein
MVAAFAPGAQVDDRLARSASRHGGRPGHPNFFAEVDNHVTAFARSWLKADLGVRLEAVSDFDTTTL